MAYQYPSARVGVPVDVRAEALYLRNEEEGYTSVCFVTTEDVMVAKGTIVRVPVDGLSASAARAIREHIQCAHDTSLDFQLKSKEFVDAVRTINSIIEEDDLRAASLRAEAAAAKVRKAR